MRLNAPIYKLKREARLLSRARTIPLHAALDTVASARGFRSWSHLVQSAQARPAEQIMRRLDDGDMLLIGARPGQGKTLLALELSSAAARAGRRSVFFTLESTREQVEARLGELGISGAAHDPWPAIETSDDICAERIVERLRAEPGPAFAAIDFLQLLDQKRSKPALAAQVAMLASHARKSGAIIACLSQVDRSYSPDDGRLPTLAEIRLPNPIDLKLFSKTCFLHGGQMEVARTA